MKFHDSEADPRLFMKSIAYDSLAAGCDAHVAKPIDLRNLLSEMDRCLAGAAAREFVAG